MNKMLFLAIMIMYLVTSAAQAAGDASLYYDDGTAEDGVWMGDPRGHAVLFTTPSEEWTLSGVEIFGRSVPEAESETFVIEVWDQDLSLISRTTDRTQSYFSDNFTWAAIDIPDAEVSGPFVISFYEGAGVYVGTDIGPTSGRSAVSTRSPNGIIELNVANHTADETDWMIRVWGRSPAPEVFAKISKDVAGKGKAAEVHLEASDPDGNLKRATFYVMDNKTLGVVWSDIEEISGEEADIKFSWPGTAFRASSGTQSVSSVFAAKNAGVPENLNAILDTSALCIVEIEENMTFMAMAYFSKDGALSAIVDLDEISHYMSPGALDAIIPGSDYEDYSKNITLIEGKSRIGFFSAGIDAQSGELSLIPLDPFVISGDPSSGYGISLRQVGTGMGEYIALVQVEDNAYNTVGAVVEGRIKVAA